jgi:hypothetical protein
MSLVSYPGAISIADVKSFLGGASASDFNSFHSGGNYTPPSAIGYPGGTATYVPASGQISLDNFHGLGNSYQRLTGTNRLYGNQSNDGYAYSVDFDSYGPVLNVGAFGNTGWTAISYQQGADSTYYSYPIYDSYGVLIGYNSGYNYQSNYAWLQWNTLQQNTWRYTTNQLRTTGVWTAYAWNYQFQTGPLAGTIIYFPSNCFFAGYLSGRTLFIAQNQNVGVINDTGSQYALGQYLQAFRDTCYSYTYISYYDSYGHPVYATASDYYTPVSW